MTLHKLHHYVECPLQFHQAASITELTLKSDLIPTPPSQPAPLVRQPWPVIVLCVRPMKTPWKSGIGKRRYRDGQHEVMGGGLRMQGLQELPAEEEALQRRGSESALVTLSWYTGHHVFSLVSGSHSREQLPSTRAARRNGGFLSQAQIPQERDFLTQFSISSHSWPSQLWPETNRRGLGAAGTAWRRRELPTTEDKQDDTLLLSCPAMSPHCLVSAESFTPIG